MYELINKHNTFFTLLRKISVGKPIKQMEEETRSHPRANTDSERFFMINAIDDNEDEKKKKGNPIGKYKQNCAILWITMYHIKQTQ